MTQTLTQPQRPSLAESSAFLVDGHVHLYPCFDFASFFDAAARNFARAADALNLPPHTPGLLLLAETSRDNAFHLLANNLRAGRWTFQPTHEPTSLLGRAPNAPPLLLIAGRQIITREKLELLALACTHPFPDGQPLASSLRQVHNHHAIAITPWAVGKWLGRRGKIIRNLINTNHNESIHLGDNAGRPAPAFTPPLFRLASTRNLKILPGTDPLPLPRHTQRPGRYGFIIHQPLDLLAPTAQLKQLLADPRTAITPFGRRTNWLSFFRDQCALQWRKRMHKQAPTQPPTS
jgi:hypothetical protein